VLQVYLTLLDEVLRHLPAVPAGAGHPGGHSPRIQTKGGDDRLDRTAMAQQREDGRHQIGRCPQPIERGALRSGEGLATEGTAIPLLALAMHPHVALPHLPSGRALEVMAAWGLRVHRWPPLDVLLHAQAKHIRQDARRTRLFSSHQTPHHG
jgi:hypothetical protein